MPQVEGGYISLVNGTQNVYNETTEPTGPQSVFDSVKRAIGQVVGSNGGQDVALLASTKTSQPVIVGSRDRDKFGLNAKMPSAPTQTAEEARLLGAMPVDPMDDIELRSVQLQFPNARGSLADSCDHRRVPTDKGDVLVAIQGDTSKPPILTYHDLGLNYATNFTGFFNFPIMRGILDHFCVYHVTAPGQEDGAPTLPEDYIYPTMEELAAQIQYVLTHFGLKSVIAFGIGAGANILARFAYNNPDKVGAMCLVNCVSTASGWIEWGYQSFNARFLRTKGMTQSVVDYLMWHHFGRNPEERNHDLVQMYKTHFERGVNPTNLAMFINSYIHRSDLNIARTPSGSPQTSSATLKMPVMNVTGALSPHVDDTVTLNGRLDPTNSTWMKISDCAMVLEEQPGKLAEAFRLFLQGEGYAEKDKNNRPIIINLAPLRLTNILSPSPLPPPSNASKNRQQQLNTFASSATKNFRLHQSNAMQSVLDSRMKIPCSRNANQSVSATIPIHNHSKPPPSESSSFSPSFRSNNTAINPTYNTAHGQPLKMINNNNVYEIYGQTVASLTTTTTSAPASASGGGVKNISRLGYIFQQQQSAEEYDRNKNDIEKLNGNINSNNIDELNMNNMSREELRETLTATTFNNSNNSIGPIRITENPLPETVAC